MRISLGDAALSLTDLTAIADYQAQFPGDQVPAGGVTYTWGAADQAGAVAGMPVTGLAAAGQFLKDNSTAIIAGVAVIGLLAGKKR